MVHGGPKVILASQSPARKELLGRLGVEFKVMPADVDEAELKHEAPLAYVKRIAMAKAAKIAAETPDCVVVAADTPVVLGRRILQKPETAEEAFKMLKLQSGRRVSIPTTVAVAGVDGKVHVKTSASWVKMKPLKDAEIEAYVAAGLWKGAAGGLRVEVSEHWIVAQHSTYGAIWGLPLYETAVLLARCGVEVQPFAKGGA